MIWAYFSFLFLMLSEGAELEVCRDAAWDTLQDSTGNSSIDKAETSLDWQEYFSQLQDTTDALPCHIHLPLCMLVNQGPSQQSSKEEYKPWKWGATARYYTSHTKTMLPRGSPCQDPEGNWTTWRFSDDHKEMQTAVVWSCFPFIRSGQNHLTRHSERGKKTRRTKEKVGRQHQGVDRPGVRQVPQGSGEQGKMEKTGCKIICSALTTLTVRGLMMMMMMMKKKTCFVPSCGKVTCGMNNLELEWSLCSALM